MSDADARSTGGTTARPPRSLTPPPPRPTEVHREASGTPPVIETQRLAALRPPAAVDPSAAEPKRQRPSTPVRATATTPIRVRVRTALRTAIEKESTATGLSFGLIAYEAVARNAEQLKTRLAPVRPAEGMPPLRRGRFYEEGGSPKIDLYLTPDERSSITSLATEIGVTVSVLVREALELRFPNA